MSTCGWKAGLPVIVLAPTAGGKTVAADIAIAQLLASDTGAKAIYALPFIALASEKYEDFVKRFFSFGVRAFYQNIGGPDFRLGDIAVCTYEKAHAIINAALLGRYIDKIKLVIIDEVHMIGDQGRGPVIEALVTKTLLMEHKPRVIGLTATVNESDGDALAKWIGGFCFVSRSRPSLVKQYVKMADGSVRLIANGEIGIEVTKLKEVVGDKDHVVDPVRTLLAVSPDSSVLVFVATRQDTVTIGERIAMRLYDSNIDLPLPKAPVHITAQRVAMIKEMAKVAGGIDERMRSCLMRGVGVHHAGLLLEERKIIEAASRDKTLSVLVATTTLSAGVNIHSVHRVLILGVQRWTEKGFVRIPAAQFTQMVGRAGRTEGRGGAAFVFAKTSTQKELDDIKALTKHQIPDIVPQLKEAGYVERFFLQCLATGLVEPKDGFSTFMKYSFRFEKDVKTCEVIDRLVSFGLITEVDHLATPLGKAIAGSAISIEEGIMARDTIKDMERDICLCDDVHLLYLCVSPQFVRYTKVEAYNSPMWNYIMNTHRHVVKLITGLDDERLNMVTDFPHIYGGNGRVTPVLDGQLDRIYIAVVMRSLINEVPVQEITRKFRMDRGVVQSLQMQCATFAGQIQRFCEIIGSELLATTLNKFRQRLNFAARTELLGLLILPSCSRDSARAFIDSGITSPVELVGLNAEGIAALLVEQTHAPLSDMLAIAGNIRKEAIEYTKSLTRLETMEETAVRCGM